MNSITKLILLLVFVRTVSFYAYNLYHSNPEKITALNKRSFRAVIKSAARHKK